MDPKDTLIEKLREQVRVAEEENKNLSQDRNAAQARITHANVVIGDLVPRLGLPQHITEQVKGLDAIDAIDLIAKRGGEFRPAVEKIAPAPVAADEQARIDRAVSPRSYM